MLKSDDQLFQDPRRNTIKSLIAPYNINIFPAYSMFISHTWYIHPWIVLCLLHSWMISCMLQLSITLIQKLSLYQIYNKSKHLPLSLCLYKFNHPFSFSFIFTAVVLSHALKESISMKMLFKIESLGSYLSLIIYVDLMSLNITNMSIFWYNRRNNGFWWISWRAIMKTF